MNTALRFGLLIVWRERLRFLPAVLAVGFSSLLVALQLGMLLGTLSLTSLPIDESRADLFVTYRDVPSIDLGYPIPESWESRLLLDEDIAAVEPYFYAFEYWQRPGRGAIACGVIGARLEDDSLGAVNVLTPDLRSRLREIGTVVVDESELGRLGLTKGIDEYADVGMGRVRVVGVVSGLKSIGGPFVLCSLPTARRVLGLFREPSNSKRTMYLLASCHDPAKASEIASRLKEAYPTMGVLTRDEFSLKTRFYWLSEAKAGIALLFTSALAVLVGLVVTSQTLYAAMAASLREFALFRALGIPRGRIASLILAESLWVGLGGLIVALPLVFALGHLIELAGGHVLLPAWLFGAATAITLLIAVLSGLFGLRSLRLFEPVALLR